MNNNDEDRYFDYSNKNILRDKLNINHENNKHYNKYKYNSCHNNEEYCKLHKTSQHSNENCRLQKHDRHKNNTIKFSDKNNFHKLSNLTFETEINYKTVEILIDTGATRNFINKELFDKLYLKKMKISEVSVEFGNGSKNNINSKTNINLQLKQLPDINFKVELLIVHDLNYDIILGMEWLTENEIKLDFKERTMYFLNQEI
ncbi:hypothetical protein DMUE_2576 [Dictyocoela muelleri]|nr:hypothetical protein DMUE_2576 [Dictyocoela muelleri]